MASKRMTVSNLGRLTKKLEGTVKDYGVKLERGLFKAGHYLMKESQKIVPIDKGNLSNSGFVYDIGTPAHPATVVGYGNEDVGYAVIVHEDLEAAHGSEFNATHAAEIAAGKEKPRRPQEQAKFLEEPARTNQGDMARIIRAEMRT